MGWIWKDEDSNSSSSDVADFTRGSGDRCSTRKVVKSQCRTEETEPGKFIRKCEKTEEIFRDCVGRPTEMVQSNKEYTEEDVTGEVSKGTFGLESQENEPFNFPGLRSDIEAMERSFLGGLDRFFEAAEEMKNGFFGVFGNPHMYDGSSSPSKRRGIPIEVYPAKEDPVKQRKNDGEVDLSGLAKDV